MLPNSRERRYNWLAKEEVTMEQEQQIRRKLFRWTWIILMQLVRQIRARLMKRLEDMSRLEGKTKSLLEEEKVVLKLEG